jgi:hypothetical protein
MSEESASKRIKKLKSEPPEEAAENVENLSSKKPKGRPRTNYRRTVGAMHRTAVYMSGEVLNAISSRAKTEGNSLSGLNSDLIELVLLSPVGQRLQEVVCQNDRTLLIQELNSLLEVLLISPVGKKLQESAKANEVSLAVELERSIDLLKEMPTNLVADIANRLGKPSGQIIAELISVIANPPLGEKLIQSAIYNKRTLAQEVEKNLTLFKDRIPYEEILKLAEASQRTPDDMVTRLALLGLETYKQRNMAGSE